MKNTQMGFTLIELLVVIAIIGILASVILASLNTARVKSRDSMRQQELTELQKAVEVYYADYGSYPNTGGSYFSTLNAGCGSTIGTQTANWIPGLAPTYIPVLPADPSFTNPSSCRGYAYASNGTNYKIIALGSVEEGNVKASQPFTRIPLDCPTQPAWWNPAVGQTIYAVYSAGACAW